VLDETRPILLVSHDDGDWQFLCGQAHSGETPHVVCVGHLVARDPTIEEVADLDLNWFAERDAVGGNWRRRGPAEGGDP